MGRKKMYLPSLGDIGHETQRAAAAHSVILFINVAVIEIRFGKGIEDLTMQQMRLKRPARTHVEVKVIAGIASALFDRVETRADLPGRFFEERIHREQ